MKKMILCLAVFVFAVPAMAAVTVSATRVGTTNNVAISYVVDGNDAVVGLRALALRLTVVGDANITGIVAAKEGESTSASPGYGIFVGSIDLADPCVPVWGDPIADPCDPDNPGQLGSQSIVVEFGSLYVGEPNAPNDIGELCTITLSECGVVTPAPEDTWRGGIVMEDPQILPTAVIMVPSTCAGACCWGDLNDSSDVDLGDATAILSYLAPAYVGSTPIPYTGPIVPGLTAPGNECGDLNDSGDIDLGDATAILSWLAPAYVNSTPIPYTGPCIP